MAIQSDSDLKKAVAGPPLARQLIYKAAISSQVAGGFSSFWRGNGIPTQASIPTTAAVCTDATVGAYSIPAKTSGATAYIAAMWAVCSVITGVFLDDRLAHMGGLSGTSVAAQTVNVTCSTLAGTRCLSDYSDVEWFLEWYTATGSTAVTATLAVTYNDDTTGNVTVTIPASTGASRRIPFFSAVKDKWIKSVQSCTLSATTGAVGNFGVTAVHVLGEMVLDTANVMRKADWALIELPIVQDDSCIEVMLLPAGTSTGNLTARALIVQA